MGEQAIEARCDCAKDLNSDTYEPGFAGEKFWIDCFIACALKANLNFSRVLFFYLYK